MTRHPRTTRRPRRAPAAALAAAIAASALGGCVVGPDYAGPDPAGPARFAEAVGGPGGGADGWVSRLGDRSLDRLVAAALDAGTDVAAAVGRLREARAARVQAIAAGLPSVGGSALAQRSAAGLAGAGAAAGGTSAFGGAGAASNLFQGGFDASWEIDTFGGIARATEAATDDVGKAEADLAGVRLSTVGEVASAYVEARGDLARRALAARSAASQSATLALTRARVAAGVGTDVDVGRAEALAASTRANVPVLDAAYRRALHRLATLTVLPVAEVETLVGRGGTPRAPRAPAAGLPARVLAARPDVRMAERALAAATARVGVAEADRYPSLSLSGNVAISATSIGSLFAGPAGWGLGPTLSVPVFDAGRRAAAADAADARREQAVAAYRGAVLAAAEDVENALSTERGDRRRLADLERAASGYARASTLARSLYERGAGGFLDVLDAERSLYQAQDAAEQARIALATDYVALCKALGGDWAGRDSTGKEGRTR